MNTPENIGKIERLKHQALNLPAAPGVYLMKNKNSQVIYVGKAKLLPRRVGSYFQRPNLTPRLSLMIGQVEDFDFLVTATEKEALILENSLIKKYRPKFNVILRDDKTYPSLRLALKEDFPRLEIVRKVKKDGAAVFGPFPSGHALKETLWLLRRLFPLRQCRRPEVKNTARPCLNYQLGRCLGPCRPEVTPEEYRRLCDQVVMFFQGRHQALIARMTKDMKTASENLEFEKAAKIRDRLNSVSRTLERQAVAQVDDKDQDVFSLVERGGQALAAVMHLRGGLVLGHEPLNLAGAGVAPDDLNEMLAELISRYYSRDTYIPHEVLLPTPLEEQERLLLEEWLGGLKGRQVRLTHPQRGPKRRLLNIAVQNALAALEEKLKKAGREQAARDELKARLRLPGPPERLECFDLSHWQGRSAVAGMVVMENGQWRKAHFRRFKIKQARGGDDYAGLREVIARRYRHEDWPRPDLLLIDGGKGQLASALAAFRQLDLTPPPLAAIAEAREAGQIDRIFIPNRKNPVDLAKGSPGLSLLIRLRDEAHRYAGDYQRRLRGAELVKSPLSQVVGLGPKRRKELLDAFGSWEKVGQASLEEIQARTSLPAKTIAALKLWFDGAAAAPPEQDGSSNREC